MTPDLLEYEVRRLEGVVSVAVDETAVHLLVYPHVEADAMRVVVGAMLAAASVELDVRVLGGVGTTFSPRVRLASVAVGTAVGLGFLATATAAAALVGAIHLGAPALVQPTQQASPPAAARPLPNPPDRARRTPAVGTERAAVPAPADGVAEPAQPVAFGADAAASEVDAPVPADAPPPGVSGGAPVPAVELLTVPGTGVVPASPPVAVPDVVSPSTAPSSIPPGPATPPAAAEPVPVPSPAAAPPSPVPPAPAGPGDTATSGPAATSGTTATTGCAPTLTTGGLPDLCTS